MKKDQFDKNILLKYLPIVFFFTAFIFLFFQHMNKPRILILQSSCAKNSWTISVDNGINRILSQNNYLYLKRYYMEIHDEQDRNEFEKENTNINDLVNQWHPDVIIAFGRNVQNVIARNFINHKGIKIVFGGISKKDFLDLKYENANNITGVIQNLPFTQTRDILAAIFKNKNRLYYLSDSDSNSKNRFYEFLSTSWKPFFIVNTSSVSTLIEWQNSVKEANKTSDLLIVRSYDKIEDKNHHHVSAKKLVKLTIKSSKIPVIGISSHYVEDGGALGIGANAELNGEDVAKLALNVVDSKTTKKFPIFYNDYFIPYLRESEFKREVLDVYIPSWYIAFSRSSHAYYP